MRVLQLMLLILAPACCSDSGRTAVAVRPASDVAGPTFTLGEVADVSGADRALAERIRSVALGTSPLPGLSRSLYLTDVVARLRLNHFDPEQFAVTVPAGVRITRRGAEVPVTGLTEAAVAAVRAALKDSAPDAVVEPVGQPPRLIAEPGKMEFQAGPVQGRLEGGTVTVPISVLVDGKPSRQVTVSIRIRRTVIALIARRTLPPHTVLTADDVVLAQLDSASGEAPVVDLAEVLGKRTTRQVTIGQPITASAIQGAPVIETGARVTLEITVGGVRISAPAIARSQGAVAERIPVFALDTRKLLTGVVVDGTTVRAEEGQ